MGGLKPQLRPPPGAPTASTPTPAAVPVAVLLAMPVTVAKAPPPAQLPESFGAAAATAAIAPEPRVNLISKILFSLHAKESCLASPFTPFTSNMQSPSRTAHPGFATFHS